MAGTDNLGESKPGDFLSAEEWNTVKRAIRSGMFSATSGISEASGARATAETIVGRHERIWCSASSQIPAYSIFGITGIGEQPTETPTVIKTSTVGGTKNSAPTVFYTNDHIAIPDGGFAWVRPVGMFDVVKVGWYGDKPRIGELVGPRPDAFSVELHRQGFVVVSWDLDDGLIRVMRTPDPVSIFGTISEVLPRYDAEEDTYGRGKMKLQYRNVLSSTSGGDEDAAFIAQSPSEDSTDYELAVFNASPFESFEVGRKGLAHHVMGVGLVFIPFPCKFVLEDCQEKRPNIYAANCWLTAFVDWVVTLQGVESCWRVRYPTDADDQDLVSSAGFYKLNTYYEDCTYCKACYKLTECNGGESPEIIYTNTDLSRHVGKVIKLRPSGVCFSVERWENCDNAVAVDYGDYYDTCEGCSDYCYHLQGCVDSSETLVVRNNLAAIATQSIRRDNPDAPQIQPEDLIDKVFEIDGKCYKVTSYDTDCGSEHPDTVSVGLYFEDCTYCACFLLTPCPDSGSGSGSGSVASIIAKGAWLGSDSVVLRDHIGETVLLDDGLCYTISIHNGSCTGAEDVNILEFIDGECECKFYTLHFCDGAGLATYTDLRGLGYKVGDVIKLIDHPYGDCAEIVDDEAPFLGTVDIMDYIDPELSPYPDCPTCQGEVKYKLLNDCISEDCAEGSGGGSSDPIVTRHNLHAFVGKRIKFKAICYLVTVASESDEITHEDLGDDELPDFPTCEECLEAVVSWTQLVVEDIRIQPERLALQKKRIAIPMTGKSRCDHGWEDVDVADEECNGSGSGSE